MLVFFNFFNFFMSSAEVNPFRRPRPEGASYLGIIILVAGRLGDVALQYYLLKDGGQAVGDLLGVPASLTSVHVNTLLGLYSVTALRQAYWVLATNKNDMPPSVAVAVVLFNTFCNVAGSIVAVWLGRSLTLESPYLLGGLALVTAGVFFEVVSEEQRSAFKRDPHNKGKPYTKGLNSIVQHPNYLGYTLWRTGLTLATGSLVPAGVAFLFNANTFLNFSIPELQGHNLRKYGEEYRKYTQRTKKLFPFII